MGQKFQYDESGGTFFYFLLSFLGLLLIPATIYYWPRKRKIDPELERKKCQCPGCLTKREYLKNAESMRGPINLLIKVLIVAGWAVLIFLAYKVSQFDYEMANFDPYEILGVPLSASSGDIKRAYRKLSLIWHPDKETGNEREFMKITKAYQALTDDEARKNWEQYGNPDGPGATSFGIALPSWIVEKENSVWVLGLYALVFMVALPIVVGTWWYRSIKFTGDQVLLDTLQMYYYFFHKTTNMPLKRVIMILAASLEFDKKHSQLAERPSDNEEIPQLIKKLPNLNEKNKEIPLCYPYSIKARAIIHAHLARIQLNPNTLELDRRYIIGKCPNLLQEQINTVNQLILLAYARRIQRLPLITSIENCMKLCPMIVQAMSEFKSPLLQLPHINEDNLKYFMSKKRQIKSLLQYAQLKGEERRSLLRSLSDEEYEDVMKVLGNMPYIDFQVRCEVLDENPNEVTAGAIVTVTVELTRIPMSHFFGDNSTKEETVEDEEKETEANDDAAAKRPVWMKQKKGGGKKKKTAPKPKSIKSKAEESPVPASPAEKKEAKPKERKKIKDEDNSDSESELSDADTNGGGDNNEKSLDSSDEKSNNEDDDQEWEKVRTMHSRDKGLEATSKVSHPVHCPLFPLEKQEYWWTYICDRKSETLLTSPFHVTNLVDYTKAELRFTAPKWKGVYTFTVCLRSDSYIGFDQQKEIKLDVKDAPAEVIEHPQWKFEDSEEEDNKEAEAQDSEYVTDEDLPEDED